MGKRKGQTLLTDFFRSTKKFRASRMTDANTQTNNSIKKHGSDDFPAMPGIFGVPRMFGFPRNIITKLRYTDYRVITATTVSGYTYSMNSAYDPYQSGVGHQPLYFDQFSTIYNHYTVLGSVLNVTFSTANTGTPSVIGIAQGDDSTFSTTIETLAESNKGVHTTLTGNAAGDTKTLSVTYGAQEDEGIDPYAGSDLIRTAVTTDPAEQYFSRIYAVAYDGTTSSGIFIDINMEFTVLFSELKDVTQS